VRPEQRPNVGDACLSRNRSYDEASACEPGRVVFLSAHTLLKIVQVSPSRHVGAMSGDEATRLMGEAFDTACEDLDVTGLPALVREIIASRIIEAAK
jgi:hypothetical protein